MLGLGGWWFRCELVVAGVLVWWFSWCCASGLRCTCGLIGCVWCLRVWFLAFLVVWYGGLVFVFAFCVGYCWCLGFCWCFGLCDFGCFDGMVFVSFGFDRFMVVLDLLPGR